MPILRWKPKSWPRASSRTSKASESFPTASTVASVVPGGRVWASSTDMGQR